MAVQLSFQDREKAVYWFKRFGLKSKGLASPESIVSQEIERLFAFALASKDGVLRKPACKVSSFVDLWRAIKAAFNASDNFKALLRKLEYSIEAQVFDYIGAEYSACVAQKNFRESIETQVSGNACDGSSEEKDEKKDAQNED